MTIEDMNKEFDTLGTCYIHIMDKYINGLPEDEYEKIPIIEMSKAEHDIISRWGIVNVPMRQNKKGEWVKDRIYSAGSSPFRIKIKA